MEISYTRYRIYRECPWKYKLLFVDGRRIPLVAKASFGLSVHRALEDWLLRGDLSREALHESLRSKWLTDGYPDEEAEARWFAKAERVMTRFFNEEAARRSRLICAEKEFFWDLGRHRVRGKIDRIDQAPDGTYDLVDYKTGPGVPPPEKVAADLQLRFYALGASRALGVPVSTVTMDFVSVGERLSAAYDPSGEEALAADVGAACDAIEAGRFEADARYCPRCDFKADCPYAKAV